MFVATDQLLEIGTRFQLSIRVAETGEQLEVPVEVVSHNARPDRAVFESGMGLRFCEMEPELRARFEALYDRALESFGQERVGAHAGRKAASGG